MTGAVTGGASYSFTYNDDGIRTSKTRNGYTTTYFLDGSRIVGEQTANYVMIYVYDAQGSPIGLQYHDASDAADEWEVFWFEKNLQGDIIAVYDESGYLAVTYTYDAWGNCEEEFNHSTFEICLRIVLIIL